MEGSALTTGGSLPDSCACLGQMGVSWGELGWDGAGQGELDRGPVR